mmetsp:Transcript_35989/g.111839  ORF Transcript_35989/g.111839 Transcript_35989/m.111839 type:complete len:83 (+) Transcript_35989:303-551(+)
MRAGGGEGRGDLVQTKNSQGFHFTAARVGSGGVLSHFESRLSSFAAYFRGAGMETMPLKVMYTAHRRYVSCMTSCRDSDSVL